MSAKQRFVSEEASADDTIECPHCLYGNPKPHIQLMQTMKSMLCRRCQRSFPLDDNNDS